MSDSDSFSDDFDDLDELDEGPKNDLFSDSEEDDEEEEDKDYTYTELNDVTNHVAKFLNESYKADKESLPKTQIELEEKITKFCTIKRSIPLQLGFGFLAAIEVISVTQIPPEEQDQENKPVQITDQMNEEEIEELIIVEVAKKNTIKFTKNWKSQCSSKRTHNELTSFPLDNQLVLEHLLENLVS